MFKETQMTKEQTRRVLEAIAECDRYIAKEEPRIASLRPEWATKALAHAKTHKAKLENAMVIGVWVA